MIIPDKPNTYLWVIEQNVSCVQTLSFPERQRSMSTDTFPDDSLSPPSTGADAGFHDDSLITNAELGITEDHFGQPEVGSPCFITCCTCIGRCYHDKNTHKRPSLVHSVVIPSPLAYIYSAYHQNSNLN